MEDLLPPTRFISFTLTFALDQRVQGAAIPGNMLHGPGA